MCHRLRPPFARLVITGFACVLAFGGAPSAREDVASDEAAIVHAVQRLTFGATQEEVARARRMGLGAWIGEQLDGRPRPNPRLDAKLASLTTITLSSDVIARDYFLPARRERRMEQAGQVTAADTTAPAADAAAAAAA